MVQDNDCILVWNSSSLTQTHRNAGACASSFILVRSPKERLIRCHAVLVLHFFVLPGSPLEILYELGGFGLNKEFLSVNESDRVRDSKMWVKQRFEVENRRVTSNTDSKRATEIVKPSSSSSSEAPGPNDVVMGGRTKECYNRPGNIHYRQLIQEMASKYNASHSHKEKKRMCELIIEKVYNSGGNFVTQDFSSSQVRWERLGGETLRLRVSQAFRNNRRRLPPAQGGKPR